MALLGENPTAQMIEKLENFTTQFICDGPCEETDKKLKDFFTCKRCLTWQHRKCMLYGEKGDSGGPVCNHCYVEFVAHHKEVQLWQRRRLQEAVQEGYMIMFDRKLDQQVWRRAWLQRFIHRFFAGVRSSCIQPPSCMPLTSTTEPRQL